MLGPPDREALEDAAEDHPDHFDALVRDGPCQVLRPGLGGEQRQDRLAAALGDLGVDGLDLGIGAIAEEDSPGERVHFDVSEPGVEGRSDPPLKQVVPGEVLAPYLAQLGEMALEQVPVKLALGVEMFVDDRGRDSRSASDRLDRGTPVAVLGEQNRGRVGDHLTPCRRRHPFPRPFVLLACS